MPLLQELNQSWAEYTAIYEKLETAKAEASSAAEKGRSSFKRKLAQMQVLIASCAAWLHGVGTIRYYSSMHDVTYRTASHLFLECEAAFILTLLLPFITGRGRQHGGRGGEGAGQMQGEEPEGARGSQDAAGYHGIEAATSCCRISWDRGSHFMLQDIMDRGSHFMEIAIRRESNLQNFQAVYRYGMETGVGVLSELSASKR